MKIPFSIKFRPQIESGEYKVETNDHHSVRIICWNKNTGGLDRIVALVAGGSGQEKTLHYTEEGCCVSSGGNKNKDLFIITQEPEESEYDRITAEIVDFISRNAERGDDIMKSAGWIAYLEKQKEQKPISSCDIVPYIDDKIAALQDMWREEKVSFDWDDMKDMIEDVARHFYHKEQKPAEWSEEEKMHLANAILAAEKEWGTESRTAKFLKSIRPQQKQEWSQEDERNIDSVVDLIRDYALETGQIDEGSGEPKEPLASYIRFVRSLYPRPNTVSV